jgi:hypothetical protein
LSGKRRIFRESAAQELEELIVPQGLSIVLILIATSDLEDALAE